jgi:hypothetical protein
MRAAFAGGGREMDPILARLIILVLIGIATGGAVWMGRRFVAARRRQALAAAPLPSSARDTTPVRILAFSSEECVQCRRLQMPALRRVLAAHPSAVAVEEIDAPATPALTSRYNILTVPSTVVLDAAGRARAVNYGFASTDRLLRQVDDVLGNAKLPLTR